MTVEILTLCKSIDRTKANPSLIGLLDSIGAMSSPTNSEIYYLFAKVRFSKDEGFNN